MGALNEPLARRIATLFRLLGSSYEGEVLGAVAAMKRLFAAEGLAFSELGVEELSTSWLKRSWPPERCERNYGVKLARPLFIGRPRTARKGCWPPIG
jgi:hypothetical protein